MKVWINKKSFKILVTLLSIVCIVCILINNLRFTEIYVASDNLDSKLMEATKVESISDWKSRINSYASRTGRKNSRK